MTKFDALTSIDNTIESSALIIYPNPSSGRVIIGASFDDELNVYKYIGQQLQTAIFTTTP